MFMLSHNLRPSGHFLFGPTGKTNCTTTTQYTHNRIMISGNAITPLVEAAAVQVTSQHLPLEDVNGKEDTFKHLSILLQKEKSLYPCCDDYISKIRSITGSKDGDQVNESWRRKLCEWCYEVTDHFKCKIYCLCLFSRQVLLFLLLHALSQLCTHIVSSPA
jgi:hypothetical protein